MSTRPPALSLRSAETELPSGDRRRILALLAILAGVLIAGFWNYHLVDGFGRDVVAGRTIGDPSALAGSFTERGLGFGFLFGAVAGVAATFTACNCVVFAMLPGMACAPARSRTDGPWWSLGAFVAAVLVVSGVFGAVVGALGPQGVEALTERGVRLARAQVVFSLLGVIMLAWGLLEMGFLGRLVQLIPAGLRKAVGSNTGKAAALGVMVGLFAAGRPFPVFRDFLVYAAQAESAVYGAGVMMAQGLGQILLMVVLFAALVGLARRPLQRWMERRPHQPQMVGAMALLAGGAFFVFYWGLAFAFDVGRWGFKLGWY